MEDQPRSQLPPQVAGSGGSSSTVWPSVLNHEIRAALNVANAFAYENRNMQRAPAVLNFNTSFLPPSIRPSAIPAVPSFLVPAQQYILPSQNTQNINPGQYSCLPQPNQAFLPPPLPQQQARRLMPPPASFKWNTYREDFTRDLDALVPHIKSRLACAINDAFTIFEDFHPRAVLIFTKSFDSIRDIIASLENVPSADDALCMEFMVDCAIEGVRPYTGPGTNQAVAQSWRSKYAQFRAQTSETHDRDLSMSEMFTIPTIPSPVPFHIRAQSPLWQIRTLRGLHAHRVLIIKKLRMIRDSMDLRVKGKDVFPFPEVGYGMAKKRFDDSVDEDWKGWDTFMGGAEFLACVKEELEHWTKLWEAFSVEVEVARRAAERKKTLGKLWGVSGRDVEMGEADDGTGAGRSGS